MTRARCACPRSDRMECVLARIPSERHAYNAYLYGDGERPEPCNCTCHDDDDLDDLGEAELEDAA